MVYDLIQDLSMDYKTSQLCIILGVSRSAYYAYKNGQSYKLSEIKEEIGKEVKAIFDLHKRRYGWRRIQGDLTDKGYEVGRYQIRSRMKEQELIAIQPKSFVPKTTQSHPNLRRNPNLLLEESNLPDAPGKVIVGDITYLPNLEAGYGKWLYLATWQDMYSRRILGWQLERHMEESITIDSFKLVIQTIQITRGLIVHSDGGGQYSSKEFRALLKLHGCRQSMTRKDNHYDNAQAESLFSRFKAELLDGKVFYGLEDARLRTFEYIDGYYNTTRRHSSIGNISPLAFEAQWKSNREEERDKNH